MKAVSPIKLALALLFTLLASLLIAAVFSFNPVATFGVMFILSLFVPTPEGVALMAITKEIWTQDIVNNLFKDNEFAMRAVNADQYVLLGKVVHIPVAGAPSAIVKNATVFPVNAVKRTDTDITYAIDTFYSTPRHIEKIEQYELAYDKRQSALGEDQSAIIEAAMDSLLYRWAPLVANCVLTTGAATVATLADAAGNRAKFTKAEVAVIKRKMDKAKLGKAGRQFLLTADHYNDLVNDFTDNEKTNFHNLADMKEGIIGRYLGFDFYMRSTVLRYRGADAAIVVVDEQDAAFAADPDDRAASLAWHVDCVERARGSVEIFDNPNRAEYYGDIYSMELRFGGRIRRAAGVYAIVEALAA